MPLNEEDAEDLELTQDTMTNDERSMDPDEEKQLLVPRFSRTILHCDDLAECDTLGVIEVYEMYQDANGNEFSRIIHLKEDKQIMIRKFDDCLLDENTQLLEKLVEFQPVKTLT